jgi:hypothetical protein
LFCLIFGVWGGTTYLLVYQTDDAKIERCASQNSRTLSETEAKIVGEFLTWFPKNFSYIEDYLPPGYDEDHLRKMAAVSHRVSFSAVDRCRIIEKSGDNSDTQITMIRVADANRKKNLIRLYTEVWSWKQSVRKWKDAERNSYLVSSPSTPEHIYSVCDEDNLKFLWSKQRTYNILCHELAHIINVQPHDTVYEIGDACSDAQKEKVSLLKEMCTRSNLLPVKIDFSTNTESD